MDRRDFFRVSGMGVASLGVSGIGEPASAVAAPRAAANPRKALLMTLGCQSAPSTDEHFAYFARYGLKNISASAPATEGRAYSTLEELSRLRDMANRHGLSLDMIDTVLLPSSKIDVEPHPAIMLADSPERDRDIEAFQTSIRNAARAGIPCVKYNMSILGVLRSGTVKGRGDSVNTVWDAAAAPSLPPTRAGIVDADRFWERIHYFLDRVIPVANEYKVRVACHPQDPGVPPAGYRGINRVLGTIDGLKQFVGYRASDYHGLNFCQGTISEDLVNPNAEIGDVIRWFGTRRKIFNVHFRNIRGHRDQFVAEIFPDEGDVDMVAALQVYREVGYDGMIMPDHVPEVAGDDRAQRANFAFCYGYIRGLLQSLDRLG